MHLVLSLLLPLIYHLLLFLGEPARVLKVVRLVINNLGAVNAEIKSVKRSSQSHYVFLVRFD